MQDNICINNKKNIRLNMIKNNQIPKTFVKIICVAIILGENLGKNLLLLIFKN